MDYLYAYAISPVDFGWNFFVPVKDMIFQHCDTIKERTDHSLTRLNVYSLDYSDINDFIGKFNASLQAARKIGWEGDIVQGPVVVPVIHTIDCEYGFMWKQSSKGKTFVVLPRPDPKLESDSYGHIIVEL